MLNHLPKALPPNSITLPNDSDKDGDRLKDCVCHAVDYMSVTNGETEVHGHYTCHLRSLSQERDLGKQSTFLPPARAGMRKE